MKHLRWLCLLLVVIMSVTMLASCKTVDEEEGATAGEWVEVEDDDTKEPDDKDDPVDEPDDKDDPTDEPDDKDDPTDEPDDKDDPADEPDDKDDPSNEDPSKNPSDDPSNEDPSDDPSEEEPSDEPIFEDDELEQFDPKTAEPVKDDGSGTKIRFLSQNIKHSGGSYGVVGDGTSISKINRLNRFTTMVKKYDPDIIMEQEARAATIDFFENNPYFSQVYDICWTWRNPSPSMDGGRQTEPILWKTSKYKELEKGYMWTSETPDRPSKSYDADADYGDVNCWVKVKDKQTGSVFTAYCVHYAHTGQVSQIKSFQQYLRIVEKMKPDEYLFAGGDYNVQYRTEKYYTMMDWSLIVDLRDVALNLWEHDLCELGEMNGSFIGSAFDNNVANVANPGGSRQIDHLMAKYNPKMTIDYYGNDYGRYACPEEGAQEGWISDHYALIVDVRIDTNVDYSQYMMPHDYGDGPLYWRESNVPAKVLG